MEILAGILGFSTILRLCALVTCVLGCVACSEPSLSSGGTAAPKCVPGKAEVCPCGGGASGVQTCNSTGTYEPCLCGSAGADSKTSGDLPSSVGDSAGGDAATAETSTGAADGDALQSGDGVQVSNDIAAGADVSAACQPCGYGSLKGLICAPSEQIYVSGATVTLTLTDCDGTVKQVSTTTDQNGAYSFDQLPCGKHDAHVSKGPFKAKYWVNITTGKETNLTGIGQKLCFAANAAKIAVLWGQWDHQHKLLDKLGFKYTYYNFEYEYFKDVDPKTIEAVQLLRDYNQLKQYQIVFFNCGSAAMNYANMFPEIAKNLKDFVHNGGSIYASDLAWAYVEAAFPDAIDFYGSKDLPAGPSNDGPQVVVGNQSVPATIKDAALAQLVGVSTFTAKYGPGPLIAVQAAGQGTTVHVTAVTKIENKNKTGPFDPAELPFAGPVVLSHQPAVPGAGRVVYTTFHNEEQPDALMTKVLNYLVFLL